MNARRRPSALLSLIMVFAAFVAAPHSTGALAGEASGLDALLGQITNVDRLAEPLVGYGKRLLFSSTSPAARKATAGSAGWFANDDRGHVLRTEATAGGTAYVLAETKGAGVLTRIWSGDPKGTLRVYVDDALVIEAATADLLGGKTSFAPEPLAGNRGGGSTCLLPVAFGRSLKVTCSTSDLPYQLDVQLRSPGDVQPLTAAALKAAVPLLSKTAKRLRAITRSPTAGQSIYKARTQTFFLHAEAEDGAAFLSNSARQTALFTPRPAPAYKGRSVVTDLIITEFACNEPGAALAKTLLVIDFDGVERVRVPLGAFFACGPRGGDHRGVGAGLIKPVPGWRLYNRFPMPFKAVCNIQIENRSGQDLAGKLSWRVRPARSAETLSFGAVYREHKGLRTRPRRDFNLCDLTGSGHVVGTALTVRNPVDTFWGEGDDKIRIDGEATPSLWGTGTEDYFGLAYASTKTFSHPLHGQPVCDGAKNQGFTTLARWHVPDPIPFKKSLTFDLGIWHHEDTAIDLATTVFFYGGRARRPFPTGTTPKLFD